MGEYDRVIDGVVCNTVSGKGPFALTYDDGNMDDTYDAFPPESEIREAREAAPDSATQLYYMAGGWDRMLIAEWPALSDDPREGTFPRGVPGV